MLVAMEAGGGTRREAPFGDAHARIVDLNRADRLLARAATEPRAVIRSMAEPFLQLQDVKTHFPVHHGFFLRRHAGAVYSVVIAPDGRTLASSGQDGIRVWDRATGKSISFVPIQSRVGAHELGFAAVEDRCHVSDLHATILHLMGLDHTRLTYFYSGRNERLTGVRGNVIRHVLA